MEKDTNIYQQLGAIQGTLASLVSTVNTGFTNIAGEIGKHEVRILKLESITSEQSGREDAVKRTAIVSGGVSGTALAALIESILHLVSK